MAFIETKTVLELILTKILASYMLLIDKGEIKNSASHSQVNEEFSKLINSDVASCFKIMMIHNLRNGNVKSNFLSK